MLDKPPEPIEMRVFQGGGGSAPDLYEQPRSPIEMNVYKGGGVKEPLPEADVNFHEKQTSRACGRHALNNLFGGTYFVKDNKKKIDDTIYDSLKPPVSLQSICRYLRSKPTFSDIDCPPDENYEQNVLVYGLGALGYSALPITNLDVKSKWITPTADDSEVIGYIINTDKSDGHWVAYRKLKDGNYKYIDSFIDENTNEAVSETDSLENLKKKFNKSIRGALEVKFTGKTVPIPTLDTSAETERTCRFKEGQEVQYNGVKGVITDVRWSERENTEKRGGTPYCVLVNFKSAEAGSEEQEILEKDFDKITPVAPTPAETLPVVVPPILDAAPETSTPPAPETSTPPAPAPESTPIEPPIVAPIVAAESSTAKTKASEEEYSDETIKLSNGMRVRSNPNPKDIKNLKFTSDEELFFNDYLKFGHPIIRDYLTSSNSIKDRFYDFWKLYITYDGTDRFTLMTYTEGRKIQAFMKEVLDVYGEKLRDDSLRYLLRQNGKNTNSVSDPLTEWDLMVVAAKSEEGELEEGGPGAPGKPGKSGAPLPKKPKYPKIDEKYQEYEEDYITPEAPEVSEELVEIEPEIESEIEPEVPPVVPLPPAPAPATKAAPAPEAPLSVQESAEISQEEAAAASQAAKEAEEEKAAKAAQALQAEKDAEAAKALEVAKAAEAIKATQAATLQAATDQHIIREADKQKLNPLKQTMVDTLKSLNPNDDVSAKIVKKDEITQAISEIVRIFGENGDTPQVQIESILDFLTGTPENPSLSNYDYIDFKDTKLYFNGDFFDANKDNKVDPTNVIQHALQEDRTKTFKTMNFLEQLIRVDVSKFDSASQKRILEKLYTFFIGIFKGRRQTYLRPFFAPAVVVAPTKKPSLLGRLFGKKTTGGTRKKSNASSSRSRIRTSRKVRSK